MTLPIPVFQPMIRRPETVIPVDVCPHCKRRVKRYAFYSGEFVVATYHCYEHGDVCPCAVRYSTHNLAPRRS